MIIISPYSTDKNLGLAYNKAISALCKSDDEWICLMDHDAMFLTPDAIEIMHKYSEQNPGCLLTCYTNRTHPSSPQLFNGQVSEESDIKHHIRIAEKQKSLLYKTQNITSTMSGFLMLFPISLWKEYAFLEDKKCLGVDSSWTTTLLQAGKEIKLMTGLYCWHTYRIMTRIDDKAHLL